MKECCNKFTVMILLSMFISATGYGQSYSSFRSELDEINNQALWRIGPFRIHPSLQFRDIGYDDNVYYQREEDNPISDYMGIFSPQVKTHFLHSDFLILSLTVNPEYVYYFTQKGERGWNNNISPEFKLRFFRRMIISGQYSYSKHRRRASSEFDVRADEKIEGYSASLLYETGWKTSFGFSGSVRDISYEDVGMSGEEIDLQKALNRVEKGGSFDFYYRAFLDTHFFIKVGYLDYDFKYAQSQWRDSYSYQVYSGIFFPIIGKIRGTLSLGYKRLTPRVGDKEGFSGLIGDTSLDFRLKSIGFRLNYKRDCHFSYWTNNVFFIEDRYGAGISLYLSRFLRIDYSFGYGKASYPEATALPIPDGGTEEIKRKDIYQTQVVGVVFRIIKNTGIGVTLNFWERDSNFYLESRKRMFVGGYITYDF